MVFCSECLEVISAPSVTAGGCAYHDECYKKFCAKERVRAAAPELLEAIKDYCDHYAGYHGGKGVIGLEVTSWIDRFRSLITKAENS